MVLVLPPWVRRVFSSYRHFDELQRIPRTGVEVIFRSFLSLKGMSSDGPFLFPNLLKEA